LFSVVRSLFFGLSLILSLFFKGPNF